MHFGVGAQFRRNHVTAFGNFVTAGITSPNHSEMKPLITQPKLSNCLINYSYITDFTAEIPNVDLFLKRREKTTVSFLHHTQKLGVSKIQ